MREGPVSGYSGREILPTNVKPTHYDLRFEPDLENAIEYEGSAVIDLDVVEDTSSISLNADSLEILETQVITGDGERIQISKLTYDKSKSVLTMELERELFAPGKVRLTMGWKGRHDHRSIGFFRSPVEEVDGKTNWMLTTHMEPTDARKVFPCFDEPALKATFTVTLVADKKFTCLGNMDVASEVDALSNGKEKRVVAFNKTPMMSTYLVSFAVGKFKVIETDSFRVPVRVFAPEDMNIQQGKFAVDLAARTLKTFEEIFHIDFPLPKMDLIAVPAAQGAMENWGLVTFDPSLLLVDEKHTSTEALRIAAGVIVHELAHQWFGNIVTMDFWEGLWLNEGFASWAELYAWETLEPSWLKWQDYAASGYQKGLALDSNKASHPIEVPVKRASDIKQIFDDISYMKGCAVIRMISSFLGIEVFVKGIQQYLKTHAYGNTTTNDLWDSLSAVSGKDVGAIMEKWTRNVGYPVIDVTEDENIGTITVTQHRFLQDGSSNPEDDQLLYPISLDLKTQQGLQKETLYSRTKNIKAPLDFYKLNADHHGFYRVSYSPQRLMILGQNAKDGLLSAEDKIGLLSDTLAMASSGHSNAKTSDVLKLLEVFESEASYFVWNQVFSTITTIERAFMFEDSEILYGLKTFKARLMKKSLKKKGWNFKKTDDGLEQMFKAKLFANGSGDPKVRHAAKDMFNAFATNGADAININIRGAVFAIVLEHGSSKQYDIILDASRKATSLDERNACLISLGHSKDPKLMHRTMEHAISPEIVARNDTAKILYTLGEHRPGAEAMWSWMKENWDEILEAVGNSIAAPERLLNAGTKPLATKEQWRDVQKYFKNKDTQAYDQFLGQSLDTILAKANWVERDREDVRQWLHENGYADEKGNHAEHRV